MKRDLFLMVFQEQFAQAEALDKLLEEMGKKLDFALALVVPDELLVERLTGRRTCKSCGIVYTLSINLLRLKENVMFVEESFIRDRMIMKKL